MSISVGGASLRLAFKHAIKIAEDHFRSGRRWRTIDGWSKSSGGSRSGRSALGLLDIGRCRQQDFAEFLLAEQIQGPSPIQTGLQEEQPVAPVVQARVTVQDIKHLCQAGQQATIVELPDREPE